ncbi:hypothetical protein M885DRAFT_626014 [Pelagophyceae sp. CCMP2097]|nr:hypothetical protein M885DRAFT_626014 [Pelagophyceae sp. CCMP2097]
MAYRGVDFSGYLDFAVRFSPLLLCQAIVPPLSVVSGRERPLWDGVLRMNSAFVEKHLIYSKTALRRGRWWTAGTYMFLHADNAHLAANLQGLLFSGPAACSALGSTAAAAAVYVGAGVLAALDVLQLHDLQLERRVATFCRNHVDGALEWLGSGEGGAEARPFSGVADAISSALTSGADVVDRTVARAFARAGITTELAESRNLVGASGGVSAFIALDACAAIEELHQLWRRGGDTDVQTAALLALRAASALRYFAGEARRIARGTASQGVDHAAHLNGALCGVAAFLVSRAIRRHQRHARRTPSAFV